MVFTLLVVIASTVNTTFVMGSFIADVVVIVPIKAAFLLPILMYAHWLLLLLAFAILTVNPSVVLDHVVV